MSEAFRMVVADMFALPGGEGLSLSGLVLTGLVEQGSVTVGDQLELVSADDNVRTAVLSGVEIFGRETDTATKGENVGLLFSGLKKTDVSCGDILRSPE